MMISLIIKSYLSILLSVSLISLFILIAGIYFIVRKAQSGKGKMAVPVSRKQPQSQPEDDELSQIENLFKVKKPEKPVALTITSQDILAVAGDDVISTQLDLARAYIETGRKQLAKKMLDYVVEQGSQIQQKEALALLELI